MNLKNFKWDNMAYKISIIVPMHNIDKYIEDTLESVVRQTIGLENLEVVMVDDCSTDKTGSIIDSYDNKYENFVVIHLSKNSGFPGKPRNIGMEKASGNYLMFLDHDDLYADDICETLYNRITNENADIVYCRYMNLFEGNKKVHHPYVFDDDIDEINVKTIENEKKLLLNPPSIWTKIFKKEFIVKNKILFPENTLAEDIAFMVQAYLKAKGIVFLNNYVGYYYRIRQNENASTIFSKNKKTLMTMLKGYYNIHNIWKSAGKEEYFSFNCQTSLPFWASLFILSDLSRLEKKELLKKAEPLFQKYDSYGFEHPAKHIDLLIRLIVNNKYDDAILFSEIWIESVKNQHKAEYALKELKNHQLTSKKLPLNDISKVPWQDLGSSDKFDELNSDIDDLTDLVYEMGYSKNLGRTITQRLISCFPSLFILFKKKNGFKNVLINIKGYKVIKSHNLLDVGFYLNNYPDVRRSGIDPILHYMYTGFKEGRKPNPTFDGDFYIKTHKDVRNSNINPLVHYSLYGLKEKRKIFTRNEKDIKLSVLVIFHNQVNYVERCIESILYQKVNFNYEIIIGDDCSNDGTWEKIQEYVEKYPDKISAYQVKIDESSLYTNSQRSGINRANIFKYAKGEYFNFLDGDDFIVYKDRFQLQIETLENHLDCIGCACGVSFYHEVDGVCKFHSIKDEISDLPYSTKLDPSYYIRNLFFRNMTIVFRNIDTDIYERLDETFFVDNYLTHYFLQYGGLYYINKPMYGYFLNEQGAWNSIKSQERHVTFLHLSSVLLRTIDKYFYDICIRYKEEILTSYGIKYSNLSPQYLQLIKSNQSFVLMKIPKGDNIKFLDKLRLKLIYKILNTVKNGSRSFFKGKLLKVLINN